MNHSAAIFVKQIVNKGVGFLGMLVLSGGIVAAPVSICTAGEAIMQMGGTIASVGVGMAVMNMTAAEGYKGKCSGGKAPFCAMAAMAVAQAVVTAATATSAEGTKKAVSSSGAGGYDWGSNEMSEADWGNFDSKKGFDDAAKSLLADLSRKGYKVDVSKGTLTDPTGKTHKMAAMTSARAMADAGLIGAGDIPVIDKAIQDMKDKYKVVSIGIAGGGGGSASGSGKSYVYDDPYKSMYGGSEKARAPVTTGLTRTLASGESIGSQTDNIFEMIRRRYKQKNDERIFVGGD